MEIRASVRSKTYEIAETADVLGVYKVTHTASRQTYLVTEGSKGWRARVLDGEHIQSYSHVIGVLARAVQAYRQQIARSERGERTAA